MDAGAGARVTGTIRGKRAMVEVKVVLYDMEELDRFTAFMRGLEYERGRCINCDTGVALDTGPEDEIADELDQEAERFQPGCKTSDCDDLEPGTLGGAEFIGSDSPEDAALDAATLASVERGIAQAKRGEVVDLGSFAEPEPTYDDVVAAATALVNKKGLPKALEILQTEFGAAKVSDLTQPNWHRFIRRATEQERPT